MQELFNHPAFQAGLAPFLVALVVAVLFRSIKLSGLAIITGFAVTIYLASDFNFTPLTSSRKIVLLGLSSAIVGLLLDMLKIRFPGWLLALLGGIATIWVAQRILQQQEIKLMMQWGGACALYTTTLIWGMEKLLDRDPIRAISAATALGIGTGASALVGASALLGQFGLALGSASASFMFIQIFTRRSPTTRHVFILPIALISGGIGCIATLSAKLPWYALAALAGIPILAWILPLSGKSARIQSLIVIPSTCALASYAVYLTWRAAGDVPF